MMLFCVLSFDIRRPAPPVDEKTPVACHQPHTVRSMKIHSSNTPTDVSPSLPPSPEMVYSPCRSLYYSQLN